jgi:hypothetical protein
MILSVVEFDRTDYEQGLRYRLSLCYVDHRLVTNALSKKWYITYFSCSIYIINFMHTTIAEAPIRIPSNMKYTTQIGDFTSFDPRSSIVVVPVLLPARFMIDDILFIEVVTLLIFDSPCT